MQSSFLRFIMMVALLISVICENAKEKKKENKEIHSERQNKENYEEISNDQILDIDGILSGSSSSESNKLAQKFANDALKSLEMQETINKLSDIDASRNDLNKVLELPVRDHAVQKSKMKSNRSKAMRYKERQKRKRKGHKHRHRKKRLRNRQPRWSKKGAAKADYDPSNKQNAVKKKIHVRRPSNNPKEEKKMLPKNVVNDNKFTNDNMTFINWDNLDVEDYIDLTQSTNSETDASTISMKADKTNSMVETKEKNPDEKDLDDQDLQYVDYYHNDIDEEQKLKGKRNKHLPAIVPKNPRARSIRQSFTVSSSNKHSDDYLYIPNENVENNLDFKYLNGKFNNFENHLSNPIPLTSGQTNDANDNFLNFQIEKKQSISSNELKPKILAMGQDQNLRPAKTNENFITGVSNFAFSKIGQKERSRPLSVGQENSVNTDINPTILQSNEHQYTLPMENDNINMYNNYVFNSGQEEKIQYPVEDNLNYLNNYDTMLQKPDEKYIYPIVHNLPEDQSNDQLQLPEVNKNVENTIESKNPINIYSEEYEKPSALPQNQQLLHYPPVYKNTYQGDRLLLSNFSTAQNDQISTNLRGNINTNVNEPLRKISDTSATNVNEPLRKISDTSATNVNEPLRKISDMSPTREHVQPVERFPSSHDLESEETWRDDANNPMNQQIMRRGLQKGMKASKNSNKLHNSAAAEEERLRREFAKRRKNAIAKHRYSVEEDVANSRRIDIAATVNETKEVADQILNRIVDELEEIKMDHTKEKNGEGFPCKLTGSWVTSKAGVRIDIKVMNHSVVVTLANLIPQPMHVGFLNTTWNVTGHAPFKRGGPFSLFAYDNRTKTLAAFVGSCRVCQGIDTIEGIWSVAREPRDCRNFQMATEIFNDVFRRTKLLSAIKEKKKAILQSMLMRNVKNTTSYSGATKIENDENN